MLFLFLVLSISEGKREDICFYKEDKSECPFPNNSYCGKGEGNNYRDCTIKWGPEEQGMFATHHFQDNKEIYLHFCVEPNITFLPDKFESVSATFISVGEKKISVRFSQNELQAASEIILKNVSMLFTGLITINRFFANESEVTALTPTSSLQGEDLFADYDSVCGNYLNFTRTTFYLKTIKKAPNVSQTRVLSDRFSISEVTEAETELIQYGNRLMINNTKRNITTAIQLLGQKEKRTTVVDINLDYYVPVHLYSMYGNAESAFTDSYINLHNASVSIEGDLWTGKEKMQIVSYDSYIQIYSYAAPILFNVVNNSQLRIPIEAKLINTIKSSQLSQFIVVPDMKLIISHLFVDIQSGTLINTQRPSNATIETSLVSIVKITIDSSLPNAQINTGGEVSFTMPELIPNNLILNMYNCLIEGGKISNLSFTLRSAPQIVITTLDYDDVIEEGNSTFLFNMLFEGDTEEIGKPEIKVPSFPIMQSLNVNLDNFEFYWPIEKRYIYEGAGAFKFYEGENNTIILERNNVNDFKKKSLGWCASIIGIDTCGFNNPARYQNLQDMLFEMNNITDTFIPRLEIGTTIPSQELEIDLTKYDHPLNLVLIAAAQGPSTFSIRADSIDKIKSITATNCILKFHLIETKTVNWSYMTLEKVQISDYEAAFLNLSYLDQVTIDKYSFIFCQGHLNPKKLVITDLESISIIEKNINPNFDTDRGIKEIVIHGINNVTAISPLVGFPGTDITLICKSSFLRFEKDFTKIPDFKFKIIATINPTSISLTPFTKKLYEFPGEIKEGNIVFQIVANTAVLGTSLFATAANSSVKAPQGYIISSDLYLEGNVKLPDVAAEKTITINGTDSYITMDSLTVFDPMSTIDFNFSLPTLPLIRIKKYAWKHDTILPSLYEAAPGVERIGFRYRNTTSLEGFKAVLYQFDGMPIICFDVDIDCSLFSEYVSTFDAPENMTFLMECKPYGRFGEKCLFLTPDPNRTWVRPVYVPDIEDDLYAAAWVVGIASVYYVLILVIPLLIVCYNCCCRAESNSELLDSDSDYESSSYESVVVVHDGNFFDDEVSESGSTYDSKKNVSAFDHPVDEI